MSNIIDSNVVELEFNNAKFESGVKTSMSTLDKLKEKLNFSSVSDGLSRIGDNIKSMSFGSLATAADTVSGKFSALEAVAVGALMRIGSQIVSTGEKMIKSLTVDPIMDGYNEYELKLGSIQTILMGAKDANGLAVTLGQVNSKLAELNTYSDKTIYSFKDMTSNIGKFTNAGVDLDTSVKAIQGVANVAAVSGANANEASRAMYNFSQALSSGAIKLIDWKSIENANMATVDFKQSLIDAAVAMGTLEAAEEGMYKVRNENTAGQTFKDSLSATKAFNDSLSAQWMTTEVLTTTLQAYSTDIREMTKYEIEAYETKLKSLGFTEEQIKRYEELGQKAFDAAQEVKSFSQLMDTLKEAVGSGWATTFELIFGDFKEAKALWTDVNNVVSGIIDSQADARNAIVKAWKDAGGRTDLIEGIGNLYNSISRVLEVAKNSFLNTFDGLKSSTIVDTLTNITSGFKNFSETIRNFTDNNSNIVKIYEFFKGISSVLKIGYDVIKEFAWGIKEVATSALGGLSDVFGKLFEKFGAGWMKDIIGNGGNFLDILSKIGLSLTDFKNKVEESGKIHEVAEKVVKAILSIPEKLTPVVEKIKWVAGEIQNAFNKLKEKFEEFANSPIAEKLIRLKNKLKEAFEGISEAIRNLFEKKTDDELDKNGSGRTFEPLYQALKKTADAADTLKVKLEPIKKVFTAVKIVILGLWEALKAFAPSLVNAGVAVMNSVKVFFNSFLDAAGNVDINKIVDFVNSLINSGIAIKLFGFFKNLKEGTDFLADTESIGDKLKSIFDPVTDCFESLQDKIKSDSFMSLAIAIGVLSASLILLSGVDTDKLQNALMTMTAGLGDMVAVGKILGKGDKTTILAIATATIEMAAAMLIFAIAIRIIAGLDANQLFVAVGVMTSLMMAITLLGSYVRSNIQDLSLAGKGMIEFAAAVLILSIAVKSLASLSLEELITGLGGVMALLLALMVFTSRISDKNISGSGAALMGIAASLVIMAVAVRIVGGMDFGSMITGLFALAIGLGGIALLIEALPNGATMLAIGAGLLLVSGAIITISLALKLLSTINLVDMGTAILGLGSALAILAVVIAFMQGSGAISGAAAIFVVSAALIALSVAMKILGSMSLAEVGISLLALVGSLVALGLTAALLGPLVPIILSLAGSMALFSISLALFGVALMTIGAGLGAIGAGVAALGVGLTAGIIGLLGVIPGLVKVIEELIVAVVLALKNSIVVIGEALIAIGLVLCDILIQLIPPLLKVIDVFLQALADYLPNIVVSILEFIVYLLQALYQQIPALVEWLFAVIDQLMEAGQQLIPKLVQWSIDIMVAIIGGLGIGLAENAPRIKEAMVEFFYGLIVLVCEIFGIHSPSTVFKDIGINLLMGFLNGIKSMVSTVISAIHDFVTGIINKIKSRANEFKEKGKELIEKMKTGIVSKISEVKEKAKELVDRFKEGITSKIEDAKEMGRNLINGLVDGIKGAAQNVVDSVKGVASDAIAGAKNLLGIHSPSRVFAEIGKFMDLGMVQGLNQYSNRVIDASEGVGNDAVEAFKDSLNYDFIQDLNNPVIKPTMDLSEIQNGVSAIDGIIGEKTYGLASRINLDGMTNQDLVAMSNESVSKDIMSLRGDVSDLAAAIKRMKIVMDSGTVVGELVADMDRALGNRAVLVGRGI